MINLNDVNYITISTQKDMNTMCKEWLIQNNKASTYHHVLQVATIAQSLAKQFHVKQEDAHIAGLLHDISAIVLPTDMLLIAKDNQIALDEAEIKYPFLLHQKISALIAKHYFAVDNTEILGAIAHHTTLKAHPTPLEMIVFLADKIGWDQSGEPPYLKDLQTNLSESLENACRYYLNYLFDEGKLLCPHLDIIAAQRYFNNQK